MPRKRPLPQVQIGAPADPLERASADDDRAFDAIGDRKAGQSYDTEVPRYRSNGTRSEPRFRERDRTDVRQTTVHLPRELLREIAVHCAAQETTFSAETERLWTDYLIARARKAG